MTHEHPAPNGAGTAGNAQGDGDNRPMKASPPDEQQDLDAASSEPRDLPADGHGSGETPNGNRERRT